MNKIISNGLKMRTSSSSLLYKNNQTMMSGLFVKNNNFTSSVTQQEPIIKSNTITEEMYNSKHSFKPIENSFAVVHISGKQYKVIKGDIIMTDRINIDVGEHIVLDKVLLVGTTDSTMIGTPLVESVKVHAYIEEQPKAEHVTIFKHRPRKNYKRTTGFQALATVIRIGDIISN